MSRGNYRGNSRGRRYDEKPKLNYKKIFGTVVCLIVIVIVIVSIVKTLQKDEQSEEIANNKKYFTAYENDKWGVIDEQGNIVIEPSQKEMIIIPDNSKDIFIYPYDIDDENGTYKTKVINSKNEEILKDKGTIEAIDNYDSKQNIWYEKDVLRVSQNDKYGLINFDGEEQLACEYDEIVSLKGVTNNLLVKKDNKYGLVNEKGQTIIPTEYANILTLKEGYKNEYIIVDENGKYGMISTSGTIIFEPKYDEIKYINSKELYAVKEGETLKLIDNKGNVLIDGTYDDITNAKGENVIVKKNNKYGLVTKDGTEKIALEYDDLKYCFSIYYIAKKDGKYGIINLENETIVNFEYININYIEEAGIVQADISDTESAILDNNLAQKFTGIISEINVDKGYIRAYVDNEYKYYNFKLEEKKSYDILTSNTLFLSKKDGKYGFIDKSDNLVVDYIYDDATEQNEYGFAAVNKNGVWGSINKSGSISMEPNVNLDDNIYTFFIGNWHLSDNGLYYVK